VKIAVGLIFTGACFLVLLIAIGFRADEKTKAILEKQKEFCLGVKLAMRQDRQAFESGDPRRQEEAALRFFDSQIIYHDAQSIAMCSDVPHVPAECSLNRDWSCLARVAKTVEDNL
jgi:hypothetical protein